LLSTILGQFSREILAGSITEQLLLWNLKKELKQEFIGYHSRKTTRIINELSGTRGELAIVWQCGNCRDAFLFLKMRGFFKNS
jgi:hypothetical protein